MKHPDDPLYIPLGPVPKDKAMPQPEGCCYPICKCTVMPPHWQTCAIHNRVDPLSAAARAAGVDAAADEQHVATIVNDLYGGASVQWVVKPNELPPGTKVYAHSDGMDSSADGSKAAAPKGGE